MIEPITQTRPLDDLGRIVIPGNIRELLGWKKGTRLELLIQDMDVRSVTVREAVPRCSLCREESDHLRPVANGLVCPKCMEQMK